MQIVFKIDAASYKQHYDEQEGDPQTLRRRLFDDALNALAGVDFEPLANAIITGQDDHVDVRVRDSYADLPEPEGDML